MPENKPTETTKKRPASLTSEELSGKTHPPSISSDNNLLQTSEFVIPNPRRQPKKLKTTASSSTESLHEPQEPALTDDLAPLKICFGKPNQFSLSYDQCSKTFS